MEPERNITLIIAGVDSHGNNEVMERVPVRPGDTARNVLESVGLVGNILCTMDGKFFRDQESLYPHIVDDETLVITP